MERWAPQKTDVLDQLAEEILHNYGTGRPVVAVEGFDPAASAAFADDLAAAITARGHAAGRETLSNDAEPDAGEVRDRLAPFKAGESVDGAHAVLVVDGSFLQNQALRGMWSYSVWLENDVTRPDESADEARYRASVDPSRLATAIYLVADAEHPRRFFADSC
jgi:uridine kinase